MEGVQGFHLGRIRHARRRCDSASFIHPLCRRCHGIVAAHIAAMDFTDMGKDLEDAMVTAADRAFGKIEAKKKGTGGAIVAGEEDKAAVKEADELAKKRAELED